MSDWKLDRASAYIPDVVPDSDLAMYRKANFGHPIGWGRKIAIVVVDMTRAFVEDRFALGSAKMGQAALRGIAQLLGVARSIGITVCFTKMVPFRNRTEAGRWYDSCPGIFGRPDDVTALESAEDRNVYLNVPKAEMSTWDQPPTTASCRKPLPATAELIFCAWTSSATCTSSGARTRRSSPGSRRASG